MQRPAAAQPVPRAWLGSTRLGAWSAAEAAGSAARSRRWPQPVVPGAQTLRGLARESVPVPVPAQKAPPAGSPSRLASARAGAKAPAEPKVRPLGAERPPRRAAPVDCPDLAPLLPCAAAGRHRCISRSRGRRRGPGSGSDARPACWRESDVVARWRGSASTWSGLPPSSHRKRWVVPGSSCASSKRRSRSGTIPPDSRRPAPMSSLRVQAQSLPSGLSSAATAYPPCRISRPLFHPEGGRSGVTRPPASCKKITRNRIPF